MTSTATDRARLLRSLHVPGRPLRLANAWDVASARVVAAAGATAVATTSAGAAWSLGFPDGDRFELAQAVDLVRRVSAAVDLPVTADIESGYGDTPAGVGETVKRILDAGAVGVNVEDALYDGAEPLRVVPEQAERIAAIRQAAGAAGVPLFVNARTDTYLRAVGDPAGRLADTLARAAAYVDAGADGVFVPGVHDAATVTELVAGIDAPVNILVGPGAPGVDELAALGVARVSLGSSVAAAAYALARRAAEELFGAGTYSSTEDRLSHPELNALLGG